MQRKKIKKYLIIYADSGYTQSKIRRKKERKKRRKKTTTENRLKRRRRRRRRKIKPIPQTERLSLPPPPPTSPSPPPPPPTHTRKCNTRRARRSNFVYENKSSTVLVFKAEYTENWKTQTAHWCRKPRHVERRRRERL